MDISLDKKNATEASIKIKIKEADYQPKVEEKIKEYSKKANIKGFRPGKVPAGLIRKMYGKGILVDEINHLLSHAVNDYIKENELNVLGEPLPQQESFDNIDWDNQKEFEFAYDLGLAEDFDIDLSKKKKVNAYEIKVDDKVMNETLDNIRKQHGEVTHPDKSEAGDYLFAQFSQVDGDIQHETYLSIEDVEKKEQKKFIGLKKGDTVTFTLEKAISNADVKAQITGKTPEEAEAITGDFNMEVKEVNRQAPAELNQEFFDKVFGKDAVKDEKEFKDKVKATIAENYAKETENLLNRDIQDTFIEAAKFELPDEFLKRWLKETNNKLSPEQIENEYDQYAKELRWNLIRNKIAEQNDIKAEHEDVMEKTKSMIREQFGAYGMSDQMDANMDDFANNYLQGENGDNYLKMFEQVRQDKVMDFLKDKIEVTTKKVDIDGFKKAVEKN